MNRYPTFPLYRPFCLFFPIFLLWAHAIKSVAAPIFEPLHAFACSPKNPNAKLILASDGNFYGTTEDGGSNGHGTVFKLTPSGTLTTLVDFNRDNGTPHAALVEGSDGNFYGTTIGTVFKMTPSGILTNLVNFNGDNGGNPQGSLVQGSDGNFYGTTSYGGDGGGVFYNALGTVFKMTPSGTLTTLINFTGTNGSSPDAALLQGSDGNFYGTTREGGSFLGTVFRMTPSGMLTTLVKFNYTNGAGPLAALVQGSDGNIYGTTSYGGTSGYGTAFKMTLSGTLTTLVNFTSSNGATPFAALVQGSDGSFYGTTYEGGTNRCGTAFKVTSSGAMTTLVNFSNTTGRFPQAAMVRGGDGNFYGTTSESGIEGYGTVFRMTPSGILSAISTSTPSSGANPHAALVQGSDGSFYGTTLRNGSSNFGTIFKMTPSGLVTTLLSFAGANGREPSSSLVQGSDGDLYGTTSYGGSNDQGTVFKMTPAGILTTLINFNGTNGSIPQAALLQASDGNFYGTTYGSGHSSIGSKGTIFKMTPSATLTTLVNFTGTNGRNPKAALVQGSDGNLYGTTEHGGSSTSNTGLDGTIFKVTLSGTLTTLVNFNSAAISNPNTALVQGRDGNFYGLTDSDAYKMTPSGTLTMLAAFSTGDDGINLSGSLVQGSDGNFYGTTQRGGRGGIGGSFGFGTVFQLTPSGTHTVLVDFTGANGSSPIAGLVFGSDAALYGITSSGGTTSDGQPIGGGQIFRLNNLAGALDAPELTWTSGGHTTWSYQEDQTHDGDDAAVSGEYPSWLQTSVIGPGQLSFWWKASSISNLFDVFEFSSNSSNFYLGYSPFNNYDGNWHQEFFAIPEGEHVLRWNYSGTGAKRAWVDQVVYTPTAVSSTQAFNNAMIAAGLTGPNALATATPYNDGVKNLLKYAFNMNLSGADTRVLVPGTGSLGLPSITSSTSGATTTLRVEFIRRIGSGLVYTPKRSNDLSGLSWATLTDLPTVTTINANWERVLYEEPLNTATTPKCFGVIKVGLP